MSLFLSLLALAILVIGFQQAATWLRKKSLDVPHRAASYESITNLLTPTEQKFYHGLVETCPGGLQICPKVRMADLLKGANHSDFARISQKHVDFVVIESRSTKVLAVLELDDWTHNRPKVQKRDQFVEAAFLSASVPLVRVKVENSYQYGRIWGEVQDLAKAAMPMKAA